jgi:transposase-like protein
MSDVEIIADGGRRRRWSAPEKLRIVEETLDQDAGISVVARRNGVAPNLLYRWRRLVLEGRPWPCRQMTIWPATGPSGGWRIASASSSVSSGARRWRLRS